MESKYDPDEFFHHKQTNGDRIRAYTDEELANFMTGYLLSVDSPFQELRHMFYSGKLLDWLKEESE